jgi:hypothetical protein
MGPLGTRRFSIGFLMAIIFLVAADVGFFRAFSNSSGPEIGVGIVTLPMANVLLLALPRLRGELRSRPFWIAFQAAGWVMVLIFGVLAWIDFDWFFQPAAIFYDTLLNSGLVPLGDWFRIFVLVVLPAAAVGYMIPQFLIALLAGRLSARYYRVIE